MESAEAVLKIPHVTRSVSSREVDMQRYVRGRCVWTVKSFGDLVRNEDLKWVTMLSEVFLFPTSAVYGSDC